MGSVYSTDMPACYGGGIRIKGQAYSMTHLLKNEKSRISCDQSLYNESFERRLIGRQTLIDKQVKEILKDKECGTKEQRELFTNYLLEQNKDKNNDAHVFDKLKKVAKEDNMPYTHADTQTWALISTLCASSKLSSDIRTNWRLYEALSGNVPTLQMVSKNGEHVKSCSNIMAAGNENLDEFYVDMSSADSKDFFVSYDTVSVPDRIRIFNTFGSLIHDSGCLGTGGHVGNEFKMGNRKGETKLKIQVIADCENHNNTYWELFLTCQKKEDKKTKEKKFFNPYKDGGSCDQNLMAVVVNLKSYLDLSPEVLDSYWSHAECYDELYTDIRPEYFEYGRFVQEIIQTQSCSSSDPFCLRGNPAKKLKGEEVRKPSSIISTEKKKKKKLQYGPSIDHCPKAPKKSDSIFERVSGAYCRHAFDRLFRN